jgi:hypothetical protein
VGSNPHVESYCSGAVSLFDFRVQRMELVRGKEVAGPAAEDIASPYGVAQLVSTLARFEGVRVREISRNLPGVGELPPFGSQNPRFLSPDSNCSSFLSAAHQLESSMSRFVAAVFRFLLLLSYAVLLLLLVLFVLQLGESQSLRLW